MINSLIDLRWTITFNVVLGRNGDLQTHIIRRFPSAFCSRLWHYRLPRTVGKRALLKEENKTAWIGVMRKLGVLFAIERA